MHNRQSALMSGRNHVSMFAVSCTVKTPLLSDSVPPKLRKLQKKSTPLVASGYVFTATPLIIVVFGISKSIGTLKGKAGLYPLMICTPLSKSDSISKV